MINYTRPRAFCHARSHAACSHSSRRGDASSRRACTSIAANDVNATPGGVGKPSNSAHAVGTDFETVSTTAFGCIGK